MNEWRWWLWKWTLATQERDFHSRGLKHFDETALSADSFQSFMHNKMHFVLRFTDCLDFPLSPFVTSQPCSRWLSRWGGGSCWRWCWGWPGWPGPWSRGGEAMVAMVAVLIWKNKALQWVNKKDIQPKIFKDIQTKDIETKDIQICSKIFKQKIF